MSQVINSKACLVAGNNQVPATGLDHCKIDWNNISAIVALNRGTAFAGTTSAPTVVSLASIRALQVKGQAVVISGTRETTQNVNEVSLEENPDTGASRVTRINPYDFTINFNNGLNFEKELNKLNSFGKYDLVFIDSNDDVIFTVSKGGVYKGFATGMVHKLPYTIGKGAVSAKNTMRFQLIDPAEVDERISWIESKDTDFSAIDLDGVNQLVIELPEVSDGATSIPFTIKKDGDKQPFDVPVDANEVRFLVNGTPDAGVIVKTGAGEFTKTVTAVSANDVIVAQIWNTGASTPRAIIGDRVYQSLATEITVVV
jgi:hypothetical protein